MDYAVIVKIGEQQKVYGPFDLKKAEEFMDRIERRKVGAAMELAPLLRDP